MKKQKSVASIIAICVLAMLLFAGCATTGKQNDDGQQDIPVGKTKHMTVEGCEQGLKITLNDMRGGRIDVFKDEKHVTPTFLEIQHNQSVVYFQFTENGSKYRIHLEGDDSKGSIGLEITECTALGGYRFEDCVNLLPCINSVVTGTADKESAKVKIASTSIKNPSDIIKRSEVVDYLEFEFIFFLGDELVGRDRWYTGTGFSLDDIRKNNDGTLGKILKEERIIPYPDGTLSEEHIKEYDYLCKFAVRNKMRVAGYEGTYVTDMIYSNLYTFEAPKGRHEKWIAAPDITPFWGAEYTDGSPNFVQIPRGKYAGGYIDAELFLQHEVATVAVQGDRNHQGKLAVFEIKNPGHRYVIETFEMREFEHQYVTFYVQDIRNFYNNSGLKPWDVGVAIFVDGESTYKLTSVTLRDFEYKNEFTIFDPETADPNFDYGKFGKIVTINGKKYLEVTTAPAITGKEPSDTVINIPEITVPAGYQRIRIEECFCPAANRTEEEEGGNAYGFSFLLGNGDKNGNIEDFSTDFPGHPVANTKYNYQGEEHTAMWCQRPIPSDSFILDTIWAWADNNRYKNAYLDPADKKDDFKQLPNKVFYIGKIVAFTD